MSSQILSEPELKQTWIQACGTLKLRLSPAMFSTWIASSALIQLEFTSDSQAIATLSCPSAFHATNVEKNFNNIIQEVLSGIIGKSIQLFYVVGSPVAPALVKNNSFTSPIETTQELQRPISPSTLVKSASAAPSDSVDNLAHPQFTSHPLRVSLGQPHSPRVEDLFSESSIFTAHEDRILAIARKIGLRTDYTFETFAVSGTNEMAHAAATAVSNRPGDAYNPLFFYGGVGVGKTHLMHAIANNILRQDPAIPMLYCTGEEFTNEIVQAIQTKKASSFKQKYRTARVLFIDDVQFLAGKNTIQEEFFHTFNALVKQNSQIVLTSDRPPHEIPLLEDRLRSRFEAGLMIDIGQPSFELRTAIFLVKAKAAHLQVPIELAKVIASRVESARKIEGIITSIRSEIELKHRAISPELIDDILKTEVETKRPRIKAKPADIIKTVSNHFHIKQTALKGKRRVKNLVEARHIAMFLMKKELSLPLIEIGQWFSGRDHTSVLHAVNKIEEELQKDIALQQNISALRMTLAAST